MDNFNKRGKAEEAKAALSAELQFKAEARRNKRVGLWFADTVLGLSGDEQEAFASKTIEADFEESGSDDVLRFLRQQAENAGKTFDEGAAVSQMDKEYRLAIEELSQN